MIQWQFIGRLHPLVLHLPIGLIFGLLLIEGLALFHRSEAQAWQRCRRAFTLLFVLSAVAAAATGYLLSLEQQSTGDTVRRHMWLGLAVVALSLLLSTLTLSGSTERNRLRATLRLLALFALLPATTATGHLGGQLTHGAQYLSVYAPAFLKPILSTVPDEPASPAPPPAIPDASAAAVTVYDHLVEPILARHCAMCHGTERQRGQLAVHNAEALMKGGASGPAILAGNAGDSELMQRIVLPLDAPGHMPPAGKSQLTPVQVSALQWWIDTGASFDAILEPGQVPAAVQSLLPAIEAEPTEAPAPAVPLDRDVLQDLIDRQVHIQQIEQDGAGLWISFPANAKQVTDDTLVRLQPLAGHITWLDLSNTQITGPSLALVAQMPALVELNLARTGVSSEALVPLKGHPTLERLNLSMTEVDDRIVETLLTLPRLQVVYLGDTQVSQAARRRLSAPRVQLRDETLPSEVLEGDDTPDVNSPGG